MDKNNLSLATVLKKIFDTQNTSINKNVVFGSGNIGSAQFNILGTIENTAFGVDEAFEMAEKVLEIVKAKNTNPILLLVDVAGQKLEKRDEWLGMYAYFAHLLKCLHLARTAGNKLISLIYNQAIGGSFIAFGMMADRIYALSHAELAVMWLEGMAQVTKIDINHLKEISKTSPVFAPGVENFKKLGGLHDVLTLDQASNKLIKTLAEKDLTTDNRAKLGDQYGGRTKAYQIIQQILSL